MSGAYAFRKIDIDALDEDILVPSDLYDPDTRSPEEVGSAATQKAGEARGLVSKCVLPSSFALRSEGIWMMLIVGVILLELSMSFSPIRRSARVLMMPK